MKYHVHTGHIMPFFDRSKTTQCVLCDQSVRGIRVPLSSPGPPDLPSTECTLNTIHQLALSTVSSPPLQCPRVCFFSHRSNFSIKPVEGISAHSPLRSGHCTAGRATFCADSNAPGCLRFYWMMVLDVQNVKWK